MGTGICIQVQNGCACIVATLAGWTDSFTCSCGKMVEGCSAGSAACRGACPLMRKNAAPGPRPADYDLEAEEDVGTVPAGNEPPMPIWLQLLHLPRTSWRHLTLNEPRTCSASLAGE